MIDDTLNQHTKASYDQLPYRSKTFKYTQPEHQKNILKLFGFDTPALKTARVLEIGCAYGGNILAFALANPQAEVIGIDLSAEHINEGNKLIAELGLNNIKLYQQDILDFDATFGKFDYIICHGVFSWVADRVQNKILEVIQKHLAENGSAIISYNTYPGWKDKEILKDIMLLRIKMLEKNGTAVPITQKVAYGKGALEFLEQFSNISEALKETSKSIRAKDDYYIYHEYYETHNKPLYLYEFAEKVKNADLIYIADANLERTFPLKIDTQAHQMLEDECGDDLLQKEQYYDFINNTPFRASIITHAANKDKINISAFIAQQNVKDFYIYLNPYHEDYLLSQDIIDNLKKEFPQMIKLDDFVKKYYAEDKEKEIYPQLILNLIYQEDILVTTEPRKIVQQQKLHINPHYRKLIDYVTKTEYPIVHFANFLGIMSSFSAIENTIISLFNGENTDKAIAEKVLANILEKSPPLPIN